MKFPTTSWVLRGFWWVFSIVICSIHTSVDSLAELPLVQVHEDFTEDPGWDGFQNRMVCRNCPTVVQNFGWTLSTNAADVPGEIGGRVDNSRVQAYYAMPIGKSLNFNDKLSASGKLAIKHIGLRGVGYIGFFNSNRHTWRVWSSMAFRIWEEDGLGQIMFDWMSSDWQARGAETAIPAPGRRFYSFMEFSIRSRCSCRPRLARTDTKTTHHRPHWQRPAVRIAG